MFGLFKRKEPRLVRTIEDVEEILRTSPYRVEAMPPKPMGAPFENQIHQRVRITDGRDLRVVLTHYDRHFTFLEAYQLRGKFDIQNMQEWNYSKNFANYSYARRINDFLQGVNTDNPLHDMAILRHSMLCHFGVPEETFLHFIQVWRDLASAFRQHCGVTLADRVTS